MQSKDYEECLSIGKERELRQEENLIHEFDSVSVEIKDANTAILLLQSQEKSILLAALTALSKFSAKSKENLEILFDLNTLNSILPLTKHEDLCTRRFALKLLCEMSAIESVKNHFIESNNYIPHFMEILINEEDIFMQEFSSLIIAEISKDPSGISQIMERRPDVNFLFQKIQCSDPDVKKNHLEIMCSLTKDSRGLNYVLNSQDFKFSLIYQLLEDPYPEIQTLSLCVIGQLISKSKDDELHEVFRQSNGLQLLLDFLNNDDRKDLHQKVLRVLHLAVDNSKTAKTFEDIGGVHQLLKFLKDISNTSCLVEVLKLIFKMANIPSSRELLHSNGIANYLLETLPKVVEELEMVEIICYCIARMCFYSPAAEEFASYNCIKDIAKIMMNDRSPWNVKHAAIFVISKLLQSNRMKNIPLFLAIQGQYYLASLMKLSIGEVPLETLMIIVEVLMTFIKYPPLRSETMTHNIVDALLAPFEIMCKSYAELKIACCKALSIVCIEEIGRQMFLEVEGPKRMYKLITDEGSVPTRNAAVQLVQQLCTDTVMAKAFIKTDYLIYMLNNRSPSIVIPSWQTCIEALFNSHLPIKFAFTGRICFCDITEDGFYITKRPILPCPVLEDFLKFTCCPIGYIYVINFNRSSLEISSNGILCSQHSSKVDYQAPVGDCTPNVEICHSEFDKLMPDATLNQYLQLIRYKIYEIEGTTMEPRGLIDISRIVARAKILGEFVSSQMCSSNVSNTRLDLELEIHLKEIRDRLQTTLIPLGQLRIGSYLERALLFKVLADKICLPAVLMRGEYGRSWVEIAVPEVENLNEKTSFQNYLDETIPCNDRVTSIEQTRISKPIFPTKLLRPNFIVDLMHTPGELIQIGSHRAKQYCIKPLPYEMNNQQNDEK